MLKPVGLWSCPKFGGSEKRNLVEAAVLLAELDISLHLQAFKQVRQKRDQAFGANAIERVPGQHQRLLDLWPIATAQHGWWCQDLLSVAEQPLAMLARLSGGVHTVLQDTLSLNS